MELQEKCPATIDEIFDAVVQLLRDSLKGGVDVSVCTGGLYGTLTVYVFSENPRVKKKKCESCTFWPETESNSRDNKKEWKKMLRYFAKQKEWKQKHQKK